MLLRNDGRAVSHTEMIIPVKPLDETLKAVRELKATMKEEIREGWYDVAPIDESNPPDTTMTLLDIAKGEYHALVLKMLWGNIPDDVPPRYVAEVVDMFRTKAFALTTFVKQALAVSKAQTYLADSGQALTAVKNSLSMARVVALVHGMYHQLDEELDNETINERAETFLGELKRNQEFYDAVVPARQSYALVNERNTSAHKLALAYTKILLAQVGLRQRTENGKYKIGNISAARDFIRWRMTDEVITQRLDDLRIPVILDEQASHEEASRIFSEMAAEERTVALMHWQQSPGDGFDSAVLAAASNGGIFA